MCTCGPYASIIPPGPCPIHSQSNAANLYFVLPDPPCTGKHCRDHAP